MFKLKVILFTLCVLLGIASTIYPYFTDMILDITFTWSFILVLSILGVIQFCGYEKEVL